jgi:hypothetical protein
MRHAPSLDVSVSRGAAKAHEAGAISPPVTPISGVVTWHSGASRYNARCVLGDLPPRYNVLAPEAVRVGADPATESEQPPNSGDVARSLSRNTQLCRMTAQAPLAQATYGWRKAAGGVAGGQKNR